jgi:xanthine dehydrogenase YagS FAD-binding subunit
VLLTGPGGERRVGLSDFHRLPGDTPQRDTVLEHGELITAVEIPRLGFARRSAYRKARDRASYAFAVGSVAAALDLDGDRVRDVRLAFGAVAHRPWRAFAAEEALRGQPATPESFRAAADAELSAAVPLRDNGYKVPLLRNLVSVTLTRLTGATS